MFNSYERESGLSMQQAFEKAFDCIGDLLSRVEKLEKENKELKKLIVGVSTGMVGFVNKHSDPCDCYDCLYEKTDRRID